MKMFRLFTPSIFLIFFAGIVQAQTQDIISWQDCLKEAAKYHPDLVVAAENVQASKANVTIAQSNQLPTVDASASIGRQKQGQSTFNSSSVGVNGAMTVFAGGALVAGTNQAKAQLQSTKQAYKVTSSQLRFDLRTAFINLWQAQQSIAISESILKLRQDSFDLINLRYQAGIEQLGALKSAAAKLSQAKINLENSKRDVSAAQVALSKAIGYPSTRLLLVGPDIELPTLPSPFPDLDALAKENPSYFQSLSNERVASEGVKIAQGAYWPTVSLNANAGRLSNNIPPKENDFGVSASVSVPLFTGFARSANLQKSRAALRAAEATTLSTYNTLYNTLKQACTTLVEAADNVKLQAEFLDANQERERIARAQYNVGLTTYDNWTIIEDNLVSSEQSVLSARGNVLKGQASWDLAKGIIIQE